MTNDKPLYYATTSYTTGQESETVEFQTAEEAIRHAKRECRYENTVLSTAYERSRHSPYMKDLLIYREAGDFANFHRESL